MPMTEVTGADREVWLSIDVTGIAFAYVVRGFEMFRDAPEARAVLTEHTAVPGSRPDVRHRQSLAGAVRPG